jgi:FkbM family methyltransferase
MISISDWMFRFLANCATFFPDRPFKIRTDLAYRCAKIHATSHVRKKIYANVLLNLELSDWLQRLYYMGAFEQSRFDLLKTLVPVGGTFVDVGANIGLYSCIMAEHVGGDGSVIAFEPMPECLEQLEKNIKLNNFKNITIKPVALSNNVGTLNLFVPPLHPGGSSGATQVWNPGDWKIAGNAAVNTLDALFNGDRLDLIKFDIQGHELQALEGAERVVNRFRPIILCEVDEHNLKQVFELIKKWDYSIFVEDRNGSLSSSLPSKNQTRDYFFLPI